jgi:hypothetical protein
MKFIVSICGLLILSYFVPANLTVTIKDSYYINQVTYDTFKLDCEQPDINKIIVRNDTIINYSKYNGHLVKSYDSNNRLRRVFITNLYESNSKKIFSSTEIYDTAGHIIYECKTQEFVCWHCFKYKYDKAGHLINKSGYSSGEIGINVSYIYDNDKLVKEIIEHPG